MVPESDEVRKERTKRFPVQVVKLTGYFDWVEDAKAWWSKLEGDQLVKAYITAVLAVAVFSAVVNAFWRGANFMAARRSTNSYLDLVRSGHIKTQEVE